MPAAGRSGRVVLEDVARLAGVGIATVDRVLNERGNVSKETVRRVLEAARSLGIRRILPDAHRRLVRIEVILARPELPIIARMRDEFARLMGGVGRPVVIQRTFLPDEAPGPLAQALLRTRCDGVIICTQEHEKITAAIAALSARGVPVVTIISDLPATRRLAYAGTDHYLAGRTAGYFMARMVHRGGPVVLLCNALSYQAHAERVRGCADYLAEHRADLPLADVLEGHDRDDLSERLLRASLQRHPDAVAIYNTGGANRAVAAAARIVRAAPVFIGHELTDDTRRMLRAGVMTLTIDQNPERQAQFAIDVLLHHFGFPGITWVREPYVSNIPFTLYGPENIVA